MNPNLNLSQRPCTERLEEAVNRFLDGDLPSDDQPGVFAHLARCSECRRMVDGVLRFRSMSRRERIRVPPAVDEAFFQKLEKHQRQNHVRHAPRRFPRHKRRLVSLRSAVVAAIVLLSLGLLVPLGSQKESIRYNVRGVTEKVEFRDVIYVIYPGVTVEAAKVEL